MGIKTGAIFKGLTFDGASSKDYGIYISGEGVFNAPERAVEMISIPGRNGAFPLDHGRFENIEVTYPAGLFGNDESDFAQMISDFRNLLCSKNGYVRLTDEYNPNEYRLAIYKSGLDVSPAQLEAGEFDIVFECKPQRFLTSGETAVAVASGGKVTNPTLFDSCPLLEVVGSGQIDIGNNSIKVNNEPIGDIVIRNASSQFGASTYSFTINTQYANVGDQIKIQSLSGIREWKVDTGTITWNGKTGQSISLSVSQGSADNPIVFSYGTSVSKVYATTYTLESSAYGTLSGSLTINIDYDGNDGFDFRIAQSRPAHVSNATASASNISNVGTIVLNSTQLILGNPLYIDLDIGEAYKIENNIVVSSNSGVEIPAELPTLPSGDTTITYDNTITQFKVVPRWWKV